MQACPAGVLQQLREAIEEREQRERRPGTTDSPIAKTIYYKTAVLDSCDKTRQYPRTWYTRYACVVCNAQVLITQAALPPPSLPCPSNIPRQRQQERTSMRQLKQALRQAPQPSTKHSQAPCTATTCKGKGHGGWPWGQAEIYDY